jgi:sugar lactone lactonase YvrE
LLVHERRPGGTKIRGAPEPALPKDETTNCAFGSADLKTLYITSGGTLYSIRVKSRGLISAAQR